MEIVLASSSPRRHELLANAGIPHTVIVSDADETIPEGLEPQEAVMLLSRRKAEAVLASGKAPKGSIIVGADTIVVVEGQIFGKPKDEADAHRMLEWLSNGTHDVFTGITVTNGDKSYTEYDVTHVTFRHLSFDAIDRYIKTGEPMGKAGAYAIQGLASKFVTKIEGDYSSVVGLPVGHVAYLAKDLGAEID